MGDQCADAQAAPDRYVIRMRSRGQITVPREVRERLAVAEGDMVSLVPVGDVYVLTARTLRVPYLADQISEMMADEGVSLADLLAGLDEERRAIEAERSAGA